ncbi:MAG: cytochrome c [Halobacteria archaeon]|nr:cytochrome c [Halobacteria archaeon]
MCKTCWVSVVILALLLLGTVYKFVIEGSTRTSTDNRLAIQLTAGEKDLVLAEMRAFLASVQQITQGVSSKDMQLIATSARKVGLAAQQGVPGSLMGKLPLSFKQLGRNTHEQFDLLALDAEQLEDEEHALLQLGALMQNCVACHAAYRLEAVAD